MVDLQAKCEQAQFIFFVQLGEVRRGVRQADPQLHIALNPAHGIFQRVFGGIDGAEHGIGQGPPGLQAAHRMVKQRRQLFDHATEATLITPADEQPYQRRRHQQQQQGADPATQGEAQQDPEYPERQPLAEAFGGAPEAGAQECPVKTRPRRFLHDPLRLPLVQAPENPFVAGLAQTVIEQAQRQPEKDQANEDEQRRFEHAMASVR
ncbi:hypothetical protein D3C81_1592510 [compost metagenome]